MYEREILDGIARELVAASKWTTMDELYSQVADEGIRYDAAEWLGGRLNAAGRKAVSRAVERLERAGAVVRQSYGADRQKRTTTLIVTPQGVDLLQAMLPFRADEIDRGAARMRWYRPFVAQRVGNDSRKAESQGTSDRALDVTSDHGRGRGAVNE